MAYLSHRRLPVNLRLALRFFLAGIAIPLTSSAQVVIEERVEITSEAAASEKSAETQVETYLIAPFDGILKVEYTSADRLLAPMPLSAVLEAHINGTTSAIDTVVSRLSFVDSTTIYCDETFPNGYPAPAFYTRFDYTALPDPPPGKRSDAQSLASTWAVTSVAEGDSVVLTYQSPNPGDFATGLTQLNDSTWSLEGGALACYTQPIFHWSDRIEAIVTVVRDTLNIHFNPAEDGTIYPTPDLVIEVKASVKDAGNNGHVLFEIRNHDYAFPAGPDTLIYFLSEDETDTTLTLPPSQVVGDTARAKLVATQYWGVVDVTAKYILNGDTLHVKTERWPEDKDEDGIADRWERDNGWMSHIDTTLGCGAPLPDCQDGAWDEEQTVGKPGDGISKLREYQGALVGTSHIRLLTDSMEVFIDHDDNPHGLWAVNELRKLTLRVVVTDGLSDHDGTVLVPGNSRLRWPGGLPESDMFHFILMDTVMFGQPNPTEILEDTALTTQDRVEHKYHGIVVVNGTYKWDPVSVSSPICLSNPKCQPTGSIGNQAYGITEPDNKQAPRYWISQTYLGTIYNIWGSANSIPKNAGGPPGVGHSFRFPVTLADPSVRPYWITVFPVDTSSTSVNPFEGLSGSSSNDSFTDGRVMTLNQDEFERRNTLHELGHALGIEGERFIGDSVMRPGIGPAKTAVFDTLDMKVIRLRVR